MEIAGIEKDMAAPMGIAGVGAEVEVEVSGADTGIRVAAVGFEVIEAEGKVVVVVDKPSRSSCKMSPGNATEVASHRQF